MFLEMLLFMLLGIGVGVFTGLVPGLHPNTVLVLVVSFAAAFAQLPLVYVLVFISALAVSNVFIDFIPSILFGAPDPDNCMSVLPGHKMLMRGLGYEAIFLSAIGGLGAVILTVITFPLLLFLIPSLYSYLHPFIHILLILVVAWMVWTERGLKKAWSSLIFLFTGTFGFLTLNSLPSDTALFPALTGLFGFSGLVVSFYGKSKLPKQKRTARPKGTGAKGALTGWVAGMMAGILPGVGSSQVSAITAQTFRSNTREFLTSLGGINAANIIFTLIAFYTLGKTRSGAAWSISQLVPSLTFMEMVIIVVVALATAMLSVVLVLRMARFLIARISSLDYRKINLSIITFLVLAVFFFTGPLGLFISFTGALLGVLTIKVGIKRSQMMGFLIFPTILYFAGLTGLFSILLGL